MLVKNTLSTIYDFIQMNKNRKSKNDIVKN